MIGCSTPAPPPDPIVTFIGGPLTVSEAQGQLEVTLRVEKLEGIPLNITFTYEPAEGQGKTEASLIRPTGVMFPWR